MKKDHIAEERYQWVKHGGSGQVFDTLFALAFILDHETFMKVGKVILNIK